jgi:signal transduction histidine kinase
MSGIAPSRANRDVKNTLIEPFKQFKFGVYVIGFSLAFVAATTVVFLLAFYNQYQHLMSIFNITDTKAQMELVTNDIFYSNIMRIAFVFVIFIALNFLMVFKLTHRYYGPLVSIERFVDEMTAGQYARRVKIRKGDELQRLVDKLNDMASTLERRHGPKV